MKFDLLIIGGRTRSGSRLAQAGLYLFGLSVTNSLLGLWAALSGRRCSVGLYPNRPR
jgi:hypothetical protein